MKKKNSEMIIWYAIIVGLFLVTVVLEGMRFDVSFVNDIKVAVPSSIFSYPILLGIIVLALEKFGVDNFLHLFLGLSIVYLMSIFFVQFVFMFPILGTAFVRPEPLVYFLLYAALMAGMLITAYVYLAYREGKLARFLCYFVSVVLGSGIYLLVFRGLLPVISKTTYDIAPTLSLSFTFSLVFVIAGFAVYLLGTLKRKPEPTKKKTKEVNE